MDRYSNHLDMGNFAPVSTTSDTALKLQWSTGSKLEWILTESLFKKDVVKGQNSIAEHALMTLASSGGSSMFLNLDNSVEQWIRIGDEEEIYFDTWLWLESDCEDFFSVSGDTTPSRGNTPIHQSCFEETPQLDKPLAIYLNCSPTTSTFEPSPTLRKKQLIEPFQESFSGDAVDYVTQNLQASSEASPDTIYSTRKGRLAKSMRCCFPNFVPNLSSSLGRKRLSVSQSCKRQKHPSL